jgi:hypothetical protein
MNPDAIGGMNSGPGADTSATNLASASAQASATDFQQVLLGIGGQVMSVVLDEMIQLASSDDV